MDRSTLAEVCRLYDLGQPVNSAKRVHGGLLHRLYRVRTRRGEFAVKVLNPAIMGYADVRAKFRLSESIAATVATTHIPVITALTSGADVVHDIGHATVMVYPWVDAQIQPSPSVNQVQQIGSILGSIHGLPQTFAGLQRPTIDVAGHNKKDEWTLLADQVEARQVGWAQELRLLLPQIGDWEHISQEAERSLNERWVISHGDLDRKNVIWSDERSPWLIDWEAAGYVQPAVEAISMALDWSGQVTGHLDVVAFKAFLNGYRHASALTAQEVGYGLRAYCGNWCGWLRFNIRRSLGLVTRDVEEQALGTQEAIKTLALLRNAAIDIPALEARRL